MLSEQHQGPSHMQAIRSRVCYDERLRTHFRGRPAIRRRPVQWVASFPAKRREAAFLISLDFSKARDDVCITCLLIT